MSNLLSSIESAHKEIDEGSLNILQKQDNKVGHLYFDAKLLYIHHVEKRMLSNEDRW